MLFYWLFLAKPPRRWCICCTQIYSGKFMYTYKIVRGVQLICQLLSYWCLYRKKNSYSCAFLGSYTRLININTCIKCISCSIRLKIKVNVSTFFFIQTLVYSSICDRDYHDQPRPHAFPNNDIQQMHIYTVS